MDMQAALQDVGCNHPAGQYDAQNVPAFTSFETSHHQDASGTHGSCSVEWVMGCCTHHQTS